MSVSERDLSVWSQARGRFGVAEFLYCNWVSDLTSLPFASLLLLSDKTVCGQHGAYVCVCALQITVLSYQNEMTKRGCVTYVCELLERTSRNGWTEWNRNTVETL